MIEFPKLHFDITFMADKGINVKGIENLSFIPRKIRNNRYIFKSFNSFSKFMRFSSDIKSKPANHFEIFGRRVNNNMSYKLLNGHSNKSFPFIEFKIIKEESNGIFRYIAYFVFSGGSSGQISTKIFNNSSVIVNIVQKNLELRLYKIRDNFFSFVFDIIIKVFLLEIISRT